MSKKTKNTDIISSSCEEKAFSEKVTAMSKEQRFPRVFRIVLTVLFCFLLAGSTALLIILAFVYALNENVQIPSIGFIHGEWLTSVFDSWYPILFGIILVLVPLLILILLNKRRIRITFLSIGISFLIIAIISVIFGYIEPSAISLLSGEWQDVLVNTTTVFKDFTTVCAIILILSGATCLSIYFCIAVMKGDKK
ncbi:hypothetical protein [Solibaculum mannosilyticum]|uniref:hypothetical protein n=1 Tax=Solibaculum mannosilyticum TaxID=2780922 RepID=UPI0034BE6987